MHLSGDLVHIRTGLLVRNQKKDDSGWGLVLQRDVVNLEECFMVSYLVLLNGKVHEIDDSRIRPHKKKKQCQQKKVDGSQKKVT